MKKIIPLILLLIPLTLLGQELIVTGKVTTLDGSPLPGANITIKGTYKGTATSIDGDYTINANTIDILRFSFLGLITQEIKINGQDTINVVMKEDVEAMDEVVVVGYGIQKKSDHTGSVASVRGSDLLKVTSVSPEQALQGKVAGVQVTSNSGAPGDAPVIRVRGVGTFNNASPLFVVDGVFVDDISFLSSHDIQSMEVLKDASATAIYGARGANGVILITTKIGEVGTKTAVSADMSYGVQFLAKHIDLLDGPQFATVVNELIPGTYNNIDKVPNIDWQEEIFEKASPIQNYNLSVSGGSEKLQYYLSGTYFNQDGIIPKSLYEKKTLKFNNIYKFTDNIKFGSNITISDYEQQNAPNVIAMAYKAWPTSKPYNSDGTFAEVRGSGNPLAALEYSNNKSKGSRKINNFYTEITFLKDFVFKSSYGIITNSYKNKSFTPEYFVSTTQQNETSDLVVKFDDWKQWVWENTMTYNKEFNNHRLNVLAGYTLQEDKWEYLIGSVENLIRDDEDFWYLNAGEIDSQRTNNDADHHSILSYLFRTNYVFKDKYLLTASCRIDGSSNFGENNKYGTFPSIALGWTISKEKFMQNISFISNMKLRGSWGITGNEKIGGFERFALITNGLDAIFGKEEKRHPGATTGKTSNPDLKWESTEQINFGVDARFFNDKLTTEFEYYKRETNDILLNLPTPAHFGNGAYATVRINAASVLNRGFEFNLRWRDRISKIKYEIGATGSIVHNEVIDLGKTGAVKYFMNGALGNGQQVTRIEIGQPVGSFYGYKAIGVIQNQQELESSPVMSNQKVGDLKYFDKNGDGKITALDKDFIGSPIPDFIFGFNAEIEYKGIFLSADFQGQFGNEIYNGKKVVRPDLANFENDVLNRWTGENSTNKYPKVSSGGANYEPSTHYIEDGSFIRLRTLMLGYSIPKPWLAKMKLKSAKIFFRGTNLFIISDYSGYTPEIGGRSVVATGIDLGIYPVSSVYSVGLNFSL